ncbi:MAG: hypothetical protein DBX93_08040 [Oscillospiraceae bacterium]|nr:MAG: hypothetical protein DBX93_08040 [Oscillospiraceae bacterium]
MADSPEKSIGDLLGSGGISQLLQNPEIAAKLPRIMEALAPVMAEMKAEKAAGTAVAHAAAPTDGAQDAPPEAAPAAQAAAASATAAPAALPASAGAKPTSASRRMALLRALSPYLSEERQSALDTVMKVSTLLDLLSEVM